MKKNKLILYIICLIIITPCLGQEIDNNLFYSCRNCKVKNLHFFGENKVLISRTPKSKYDYIYLLNSNNLFVDTLTIASTNGKIIKISDNEFITLDLNIPIQIKIINNKFVLNKKNIFATSSFKNKYLTGDLILDNKYILGQITKKINGKRKYNIGLYYINISNSMLKIMTNIEKERYEFIINKDYYMLDYNKRKKINVNIEPIEIINYNLTKNKRSNCTSIANYYIGINNELYYYGFFTYVFNKNNIYYFDMNSQTLFFIDRTSFSLKNYYRLPIQNPDKNAWAYYYDFKKNKHYLLQLEKNIITTGKINKTNFKFNLFELNTNNKELVYLCYINYIPKIIIDNYIYKIVKNNENGYDILRTNISDIITKKSKKLKILDEVNVK